MQTHSQVEQTISEILNWAESSGEKIERYTDDSLHLSYICKSKKWTIYIDPLLDILCSKIWDNFLFPDGIIGTGKTRTQRLCELFNEKKKLKRFLKLKSFR
jgi:hypothetical protein